MARLNPEIRPFGVIPWTRLATDGTFTTGNFTASSFGMYQYYRSWYGSVTAGYKSLKRRQRMKLTCLDHSYSILQCSGVPYAERQTVWYPNGSVIVATYDISNSVILLSSPSVAHLGEAYNSARARLAEKVNNMSINLAQAFGERRQTADLMISTASRVAEAARALRHGRLGDFTRALSLSNVSKSAWKRVQKTPIDKRLAHHWLEFQYGWKPLLQDLYGAAELLAQHSQERYTTSNTGTASSRSVYFDKGSPGFSPETLSRVNTRTKLSLTYAMDSASKAGLASTGISNPALLAWELLPYSFVVDWFVPVGNYLQALNAFSGFVFVDGWQVSSTLKNYQQTWYGNTPKTWNGAAYVQTSLRGSAVYQMRLYNRTKLTALPGVGSLSFKNPIGGDPVERFATAASLLRVLFK